MVEKLKIDLEGKKLVIKYRDISVKLPEAITDIVFNNLCDMLKNENTPEIDKQILSFIRLLKGN